MRMVFGVLASVVTGAVFWIPGPSIGLADGAASGAALETAAGKDELVSSFFVLNGESGRTCEIRLHAGKSGFTLTPTRDCERVWPGLGGARVWRPEPDGIVRLIDEGGAQVLALAEADGLAYEAIQPVQAMINVSFAD